MMHTFGKLIWPPLREELLSLRQFKKVRLMCLLQVIAYLYVEHLKNVGTKHFSTISARDNSLSRNTGRVRNDKVSERKRVRLDSKSPEVQRRLCSRNKFFFFFLLSSGDSNDGGSKRRESQKATDSSCHLRWMTNVGR